MVRAILVAPRHPNRPNRLDAYCDLLNRKLAGDNIEPRAPTLVRRDGLSLALLNPNSAVRTHGASFGIGILLDAGDDWYDALMVGHNPFNPSARDRVFPIAEERDIGVLVMFAVRKALASPEGVRRVVAALVEAGQIDPGAVDANDPLGFLLEPGGAATLSEAAYRFARHEPGCNVVLTGTGNVDHLRENVFAINGPPLPLEHQKHLQDLFGHIDSVTGD